jgi:predicted RNA binding protein YcfA (HicA-like mRNA interferase family)
MKIRDVLRMVAQDAWVLKNQEGSHRHYVHPVKGGKVTISGHLHERGPPDDLELNSVNRQDSSDEIRSSSNAPQRDGARMPRTFRPSS